MFQLKINSYTTGKQPALPFEHGHRDAQMHLVEWTNIAKLGLGRKVSTESFIRVKDENLFNLFPRGRYRSHRG